jgi:DNA polymerase-3 subunit delta'
VRWPLRRELKSQDRALASRLAEGAVGRALTIDLGVYLASRQDALILLRNTLREPDYSVLFRATESYRAGADGQEKTINLLRALGSLIEDLLLIVAGTPQLIRNLDIEAELLRLAQGITVDWIDGAARAMVQVEQGMRRNLLRSLSLDALAVSLDKV